MIALHAFRLYLAMDSRVNQFDEPVLQILLFVSVGVMEYGTYLFL